MIPKRVEFEFGDAAKTVVTFTHSRAQWISWSARVTTAADRAKHRLNGVLFTDDFIQPTLIHAQRLIDRVRVGERESRRAGVGT